MGGRVLIDVRAESQDNKSVIEANVTTVEFSTGNISSSGCTNDERGQIV